MGRGRVGHVGHIGRVGHVGRVGRVGRVVHILAHGIPGVTWAAASDRQGLADLARPLEPTHRTLGREVIRGRAVLPPPPPPHPDAPLPETGAATDRITEALRRAIRLAGLAYTISALTVSSRRQTIQP
ncbi:MAG: hypothetical protein NTW21_34110 [Verrucomicrobia bacterium]|nr:hypothetical protein [Verrucomicrobiota bacterium]